MEPLAYALVTAAVAEPVTRTELMAHLREHRAEQGALVDSLGAAARENVENDTRRQLMPATYDLFLEAFADEIRLPRSPLLSVTSIIYVDPDGDTQTLATSVYTVDTATLPGRVYLAYGESWPLLRAIPKAVTVRFAAGHLTPTATTAAQQRAAVPDGLRAAVKVLVEVHYDGGGDGWGMKSGGDLLLDRYRALIGPHVVPRTNHVLRLSC